MQEKNEILTNNDITKNDMIKQLKTKDNEILKINR